MRKRAKDASTLVVGIAWYRTEDWSRLKAMFPDGDQLEATHAKWLVEAEKVERRLRREGHVVKRICIDPAAFRGWCLLKGIPMDANARTEYAAERVQLEDAPANVAPEDNFSETFRTARGKVDAKLKLGF